MSFLNLQPKLKSIVDHLFGVVFYCSFKNKFKIRLISRMFGDYLMAGNYKFRSGCYD
jgi:hypothetical protein